MTCLTCTSFIVSTTRNAWLACEFPRVDHTACLADKSFLVSTTRSAWLISEFPCVHHTECLADKRVSLCPPLCVLGCQASFLCPPYGVLG